MVKPKWGVPYRKDIVCVDSYNDRIPHGRVYSPNHAPETFSGLMQLLSIIESRGDENDISDLPLFTGDGSSDGIRKGTLATFELQVLFRQHSSWQGLLKWKDKNEEHSFRSALEFIFLMDSALENNA